MAEEDEIDVLGDFSLDNINSEIFDNSALVSQNSDFFQCDYTIHPQWLLDKPSANPACWYNNNVEADLNVDFEQQNNPSSSQTTTTESITDESGWTEKEKSLLTRGIEIFGRSNARLSQIVGSKTPAEVKYYLSNFYADNCSLTYGTLSDDVLFESSCIQECIKSSGQQMVKVKDCKEILDGNDIPASIEEVITAVTTAETTIPQKLQKHQTSPKKVKYVENPRSLLKKNVQKTIFTSKRSTTSEENKKYNSNKKFCTSSNKRTKFKFKTDIKLPKKVKKDGKIGNLGENVEKTEGNIHIFTGNGLGVRVCNGEQVIKIQKSNPSDSESDIEIDIEEDENDGISKFTHKKLPVNSNNKLVNSKRSQVTEFTEKTAKKIEIIEEIQSIREEKKEESKIEIDFTGEHEEVVEEMKSTKLPESEKVLESTDISEMEKFIFVDFFSGKPAKTPLRYLKIRNHILSTWKTSKPIYVTKTSIRPGLKNCGDVKNIGRIHNYLEQIGAINFNCEQVNYIRPFSTWYETLQTREKTKEKSTLMEPQKLENRSRKKKFINDGEGGCTLTHNETGGIIKTTVVNEEPVQKLRNYVKKPTVRLIYCRPFQGNKKQDFHVKLDLSVLLLLDLHAHMSLTEVMGLVGGYYHEDTRTLTITRYEACKNVAPSLTHCDMCPVSQARAVQVFEEEGLTVLGWFHSHPTFPPEPSQTDLDTQLSVQQHWLGAGGGGDAGSQSSAASSHPYLGVILSPYNNSVMGAPLTASPYRCLTVTNDNSSAGNKDGNKDGNGGCMVDSVTRRGEQLIPYKYHVEVTTGSISRTTSDNAGNFTNELVKHLHSELLARAKTLVEKDNYIPSEIRLAFDQLYFQDNKITYLDKFIASVKMHLAKCSNLNKATCDLIINGLTDICLNQ